MGRKVTFWCNSGANIHSCRKDTIDIADWGYTDKEWDEFSEKYKEQIAEEWAWNGGLEIGFEEVD